MRDLLLATDVRTYGITERQPPKGLDDSIRFELGEMDKEEAQAFIATAKQKGKKLARKLIVDFEEIYA